MPYKFKKVFLTGCDHNTEWTLPWFIENYKKHNSLPLVVADFGMTKEMRESIEVDYIITLPKIQKKSWFQKPTSMLRCPAEWTCWIDTDAHVLGNIEDVFDHVENNKLSMCEDLPWIKRRKQLWHNSGVVAFRNKPSILRMWEEQCKIAPIVGDQEVLHGMLNSPLDKMVYVNTLPNKYNVTRIQIMDNTVPKDMVVMHWTGNKGKEEIRKLIVNG
jgi:hypothetical protein